MLHAINGKEISDNNRAAHLQFDISEGVFYGNGGCNNISGSIEHSETTITFSKVAATLMHCENIEDEHKFLSKLEDATYNIQLSRDDLRLSNDENELIFKRDRKSTRLNSSHVAISYAVFCLKKKKT